MCTSPNYMLWTGDLTKNNRPKLKFLGKCNYDKLLEYKLPFIQIPCGQCLECRLQQTRQWADRCVLEAKKYTDNYFVTLTYDDEHLPPGCSLNHRDVQLFMKRLRKHFKGTKIRFLMSGEYGDTSMRPHYHILLFNCPLKDVSIVFQMYDPVKKRYINYLRPVNSHSDLYWSRTIYDLWITFNSETEEFEHLGNISVGKFTYDTAAYVSQYVMKKANPKMARIYQELGIVPEYIRMSNRPGIGAEYFEDHDDGVYSTNIIVPSSGEAHKACTPRYFDKLFIKKYGEDVFLPIRKKRLEKRCRNEITYTHDDHNDFIEQARIRDYNLKKRQKLRKQI